ncbi:MAG: hypothetical protein GQ570_05495 [Helicobacteraceae bacterium]|nr:hypothetical protein [Helicobacteraceae bacterium]
MNKSKTNTIGCFTQLIAYTLKLNENNSDEIYTIEKVTSDYDELILVTKSHFSNYAIKDDFEDALFPIIAWIDETILNSEYIEKKAWRKNLLQKKLFNTSNAGNEFFDKLNKLSANVYNLRILYMYALMLGFKGKYYTKEAQSSLDTIFKEQKKFVKESFKDEFPSLSFDSAYPQHMLPQKKEFKTSYKSLWITISLSLLAGLIAYIFLQAYLNDLLAKSHIF